MASRRPAAGWLRCRRCPLVWVYGSTAWSAEGREALAAVAALTAALDSVAGAGAGRADPSVSDRTGPSGAGPLGDDPLRVLADACLDGMADMARVEARFAALKVLVAAAYVRATDALAAPAVALQDAKCQEMAVTAEVACVLTVGAGTAGAFLGDCLALTNRLPLTLAALGAGTISWAHARVMVDETANLDPAGAAALEAHFLDPDAPNPARGCPAGDLVPYRFRSKVRTWRERHHPDSIEQRHTKSVKDRRVEFRPDSDGMAWFSAYLPADTAAGIWDRTTAAARALQGAEPARTGIHVHAGMCASRGRRSSSPCPCCPSWAPRRNRRCWTDTGRSRRPRPGAWSPTARSRSTGSWSTPGTGRRWKSGGPALPQTPPPQTQFSLDTGRGQQRHTPRLDLTLRKELPQRTAGLGTTPLATRHPENVR